MVYFVAKGGPILVAIAGILFVAEIGILYLTIYTRPGLRNQPGPLPLWDNKSNHKQQYFPNCQGYVDTIRSPFPKSVNQRGGKKKENTEVSIEIHCFSFLCSMRCLKALILLPYSPVIISPTRSIPVAAPSENSETAFKGAISARPV